MYTLGVSEFGDKLDINCMTNIIQRKYKASRRLGVNLWGRAKDPFNTRNYPPGQHGSVGFKKTSDFGKQFVAHQKFKCYYRIYRT